MEMACDARERCPGFLALTCGTLGTLGFVWGSFAVLLAGLGRPKSCGTMTRSAGNGTERGKPSSEEPTTVLLFFPCPLTFLEEDRE
jgi:hypothetical protein